MAKITIIIQDNPNGSLEIGAHSSRPIPQNPDEQTEAEKVAERIRLFILSLGTQPTIQ